MTNEIQPIDWTTIELHLKHLSLAFSIRQAELHDLSTKLTALRHTYCTGTEHWRDANANGQSPKLYVIHHTNTDCPIHGSPAPGKRIRTYIGSKQAKITDAREAIAKGQLYKTTMADLRQLHQNIKRAAHTLKRIYWDLGLDLPQPPSDTTPEENHD